MYFPTNWGAKEPQNHQNHRVDIAKSLNNLSRPWSPVRLLGDGWDASGHRRCALVAAVNDWPVAPSLIPWRLVGSDTSTVGDRPGPKPSRADLVINGSSDIFWPRNGRKYMGFIGV